VRNIDVAPTVMEILGVQPARTVEGRPLERILRRGRAED
jgi:arylsulfatase A-like enzyme